ncbi:MAG: C-type lectin domain-containing protein [Polyangiales bacterium]
MSAATLVITRNCGNVECPAVGGDAVLRSCYGGRCADPRCTVETPELCPAICASDAECSSSGCRRGRCVDGACFSIPDDASCATGQACRGDGVCVARGRDGGPRLDGGFPEGGCVGVEVCNGADDDCDGNIDEDLDAPEVCNGVDDDCDGIIDEDVVVRDDVCNDVDDDCDGVTDEGGPEACNGVDDDCDTLVDESAVCGDCEPWTSEGRTYLFCAGETSWLAALDVCVAQGANLLEIDDLTENLRVAEQFGSRGFGAAWIGLNDREEEGIYVWESGASSTYRNWGDSEPDNFGNEDCAVIRADGRWNDQDCDAARRVVCERAP